MENEHLANAKVECCQSDFHFIVMVEVSQWQTNYFPAVLNQFLSQKSEQNMIWLKTEPLMRGRLFHSRKHHLHQDHHLNLNLMAVSVFFTLS